MLTWDLLDEEEKEVVHTTILKDTVSTQKKGRLLGKIDVTEWVTKMGLGPEGPTLYTFGHGDMYYDI
jgi:hypothetical protein